MRREEVAWADRLVAARCLLAFQRGSDSKDAEVGALLMAGHLLDTRAMRTAYTTADEGGE
ncbi:MAG TPA: hypothetical protein VHN99_03770 [Deinococcales bacterium]|nr:hypothetical protein [Deinococcales bacterium]